MTDERREEITRGAMLTKEEWEAGWHCCPDWDFLCVGPGTPEWPCVCARSGDLKFGLEKP